MNNEVSERRLAVLQVFVLATIEVMHGSKLLIINT